MSKKVESKLDVNLHHAAATGSAKLLQKILDTGKVHVDCQDEDGISPLMAATANNRSHCVKILLAEGAVPNLKSNDGTSAIFLAARCGYSNLLSLLLENVENNSSTSRNSSIKSQLSPCSSNETVKINGIISDCNGVAFTNGETKNGTIFSAQNLGELSPSPEENEDDLTEISNMSNIDLSRNDGITPLIMASAMNHQEAVDVLLGFGINPNEESKIGSTPLFHACLRGHIEAANRLLQNPSTNLQVLKNGETCLHAAATSGNPKLVKLLLEHGADPALCNDGGQTALDLLMMFVNYGNITLTPNLLKVLQLLPENSIQLEQDAENQVPQNLTEMQKIHKLVRIYCPFTYIHFKNAFLNSNMTEQCEHHQRGGGGSRYHHHHHRWKSTQSLHYDTLKKSNNTVKSNLTDNKSKFMSLNGSPNKINHVRFTPDTKDEQTINGQICSPKNFKIEMVQCRLLTTDEVFKAVKRSPVKIMIKKTN